MPRTDSCSCPAPTLEEVLAECPANSLVTPAANKPVRIRPFKRTRFEDGPEPERSPSPEPSKLSPRKLDMDQAGVVLASDLPEEDGDDEEDEPVETTQPYPPPDEVEEGEIIPALTRTTSAALS